MCANSFFLFILKRFVAVIYSSKYGGTIMCIWILKLCILRIQNETHHSSVPFFSDMMISPLISLLKGQHFQNAFIVDINPKHLY
jgi:hypothetical protein